MGSAGCPMITDWICSFALLEIHCYFQKVCRQKDRHIHLERLGGHNKHGTSAYKSMVRGSPILLP